MNEPEQIKLIEELKSMLNGDPEHDADVLMEWGNKYRDDPEAELLNREISRRMFEMIRDEDEDLPSQVIDDLISDTDDIYDEACSMIANREFDRAIRHLRPVEKLIRDLPMPQDTVWMDFSSYLDALVYQDYYEDEINGREIGRHPLKPGRILFTLGTLLIETGRADEAIEPLELLLDFDPVCPKYLFEMGEAYKRTGQIREAADTARWALECASNRAELARGYRDLAWCLSESGSFEDALILNLQSLRFQSSRHAEAEIAWIRKNSGLPAVTYDEETIRQRCEELELPSDISETVLRNLELLDLMQPE